MRILVRVKSYFNHPGRPNKVGGSLPRSSGMYAARVSHVRTNADVAKEQLELLDQERKRLLSMPPGLRRDTLLEQHRQKTEDLQRLYSQDIVLQQSPHPTVQFRASSPKKLIAGINRLRSELRGMVSTYTEEEYKAKGGKAYVSEDGNSGFYVTKDGELISVFSSARGRGESIMRAAIKAGATHLDCYDHPANHHLPELYSRWGFRETERLKWDNQYAPSGWNYEKNNHPDVVFMSRSATHG